MAATESGSACGAASPGTGRCMDTLDDVATDLIEAPVARRRHRRQSGARHRRPTMLLGALVAGGVAAGVLGAHGLPSALAQPTSVAAAQKALLTTDGTGDVGMPQASITVAEAQARLQEVAASRAARAQADQAAREAARPKAAMPVHGAQLTTCFCMRWGTFHYGIDLAAPMYTPEYAAEDGVVLRAGPATGFGLAVYILHADGYVTVYGHMDSITVDVGQYVQAGQTIALLGMRGQSTGPHLHFEVHQGGEYGTPIDPIPWLHARGVTV
jgi:murein DD-endopeptidase MepM/ murein hydrolase activator NlpD